MAGDGQPFIPLSPRVLVDLRLAPEFQLHRPFPQHGDTSLPFAVLHLLKKWFIR